MKRLLVVALLALASPSPAATSGLLTEPITIGKPSWFGTSHVLPARGDYTLDAAGERIAFVIPIQWNETATSSRSIARIHFRTVTVTSSQTLRVCLEDLDASGDPDGVCDQFRTISPATNRGLRTGLITSDGTDSGAMRSVTNGQRIAIVIDWSGTAGNLLITNVHSSGLNFGDVYPDAFTASWAKTNNTNQALTIAVEFSDGGFAQTPGVIPFVGHTGDADNPLTSITFNNSSTPDERGNVWIPDRDYTVSALWAYVDYDNSCDLVLYNSGNTAIATGACPSSAIRPTATDGMIRVPVTPVSVTAGATYRIAIKPGASNVLAIRWSAFSNAALEAWWSTSYSSTSRTDAGSWDDSVTTDVIYCGVVVNAIPASGGGVSAARVPNGM